MASLIVIFDILPDQIEIKKNRRLVSHGPKKNKVGTPSSGEPTLYLSIPLLFLRQVPPMAATTKTTVHLND
jgi:hypothetical protein